MCAQPGGGLAAAAPVAGLVLLAAPVARPELPKVKPPEEPDSVLVLEAAAATDAEAKLNENVGQLVDVTLSVAVPKGDEVVVEGAAAAAGALPKLVAPKPDVTGEEENDDDPNDEVDAVEEREEPSAGAATEDPNDPNVDVPELPKDPNAVVAGGGEGLDPNGAAGGEAGGDPNVEVPGDGEGEDPNSEVPAGRSSVAVVSADARLRLPRPRGEREPRAGPPGLSSSSTDSRSTADDGAAVTGEVDEDGSGEAPLPPEKEEGVGAPPVAASWGTGEAGASAAPPKLTRSLEGVSGPPAPADDASPGCSAAAVAAAASTSG